MKKMSKLLYPVSQMFSGFRILNPWKILKGSRFSALLTVSVVFFVLSFAGTFTLLAKAGLAASASIAVLLLLSTAGIVLSLNFAQYRLDCANDNYDGDDYDGDDYDEDDED